MKSLLGSILLFLLACCFFSCEESDDFSSDPNLKLTFSSDTVRFDTVFTGFGSATRRLLIYNRNSNSLTIQSVELASGGKSGFRINVDGVGGTVIRDVDILKKDSVYLFVEVTVNPLNQNSPLRIRDSIRFNLNGRVQYIQLEAIGQDVIWWKTGKTIAQDTTLTAEKPILVYDSIVVDTNAVLTIEKSVRLYFHKGAGMKVYGSVNVKGTLEEPVVFRGDRTDNIFTDVPYDRIPGQWEGIVIDSISYNNNFDYFFLRNAVKGIWFNASDPSLKKAVFTNSIIQNTNSHGIYAINSDIEFYNSLLANAGGSVAKLIGGSYTFLHCTLANYMSWWGMRKDAALTVGNVLDDGQTYVVMDKCEFRNSIIAGLSSSEIKFQNKIFSAEKEIGYYFENCLIKSGGEDDDQLVNIVWNVDPEFKNINKDRDYYYSFDLDSISPAINKANPYFSTPLPLDIRGVARLSDQMPDIGCFEWIPTPEQETRGLYKPKKR
ncbi:choice-of-anchor Q domain-containing protein [Viscerimonas tarda]